MDCNAAQYHNICKLTSVYLANFSNGNNLAVDCSWGVSSHLRISLILYAAINREYLVGFKKITKARNSLFFCYQIYVEIKLTLTSKVLLLYSSWFKGTTHEIAMV